MAYPIEDGYVEIRTDVLDRLSEDIKILQEKYEFEKHELEKWTQLAKHYGFGTPLDLEMWLKGQFPNV